MKRWQVAVLIFELLLFAAILILPQVALPDFTFHDGTAPVLAHARVCDHAAATSVAVAPRAVDSTPVIHLCNEVTDRSADSEDDTRLSRLCVLIC
jgi:hypothetical protein